MTMTLKKLTTSLALYGLLPKHVSACDCLPRSLCDAVAAMDIVLHVLPISRLDGTSINDDVVYTLETIQVFKTGEAGPNEYDEVGATFDMITAGNSALCGVAMETDGSTEYLIAIYRSADNQLVASGLCGLFQEWNEQDRALLEGGCSTQVSTPSPSLSIAVMTYDSSSIPPSAYSGDDPSTLTPSITLPPVAYIGDDSGMFMPSRPPDAGPPDAWTPPPNAHHDDSSTLMPAPSPDAGPPDASTLTPSAYHGDPITLMPFGSPHAGPPGASTLTPSAHNDGPITLMPAPAPHAGRPDRGGARPSPSPSYSPLLSNTPSPSQTGDLTGTPVFPPPDDQTLQPTSPSSAEAPTSSPSASPDDSRDISTTDSPTTVDGSTPSIPGSGTSSPSSSSIEPGDTDGATKSVGLSTGGGLAAVAAAAVAVAAVAATSWAGL